MDSVSKEGESSQISVNVTPLIEAHKHLRAAIRLIQTQPSVGPLTAVQVGVMGAEAILGQTLVILMERIVITPPDIN